MFSTPRRGSTRLAAGSVLAATALASGAFAALGSTLAHADGATGVYSNSNELDWNTTSAPVTALVNVPDTLSSPGSVALTLHNVQVADVTGLHVTLTAPNAPDAVLLTDPSTVGGKTALSGDDVTFSSDDTALSNDIGAVATGDWTLTVSDDNGVSGSIGNWDVTFTEAPIVTAMPQEQDVASGTDATFTAAAEGAPAPTVQWESSTNETDWNPINGATSPSYTVTAPTTAQSGTFYRAVFSNSVNGFVASDDALLNVSGTAPTVTQQPTDVTVQAGNPVSFTAAGSGDPAITGVQWEKSTDNGANWQWIDGATSATYSLPYLPTLADNNTLFNAIFTNDVDSVTSNSAKLTVTGTLPSKPRNVTVTQTGPGAITIRWSAPASVGVPAMTGYDPGYSAGQSGNGEFVAGSALSDTFKGLSAGKYTASVATVNAAGESVRVFVPVTVVAPVATPKAVATATRVVAGGRFVLMGVGPANATLTIKRALPGKGFVKLATVKTKSWGAYAISIPVMHTATYKVVTSAGRVSNQVTVTSPYAVHVRTLRTAVRAYTIKGWLTPAAAGRTVHITATVAGKVVKIATVTTSSTGTFRTHYKFAKKGPITLHVRVGSSSLNTAGSASKAMTVS